ncbi:hypothetical protein Dsin_009013 [Dipteronia sinensis]|uniref:RNase H type-1 domain-containing protein n=1 Tax=Dipteronia sinensis TaxID=43782 RepID=A0AAE0AQ92_9ROSI|nr:hypothetical protein Dsin_009013 [Dipteronia sinensis]
MKTATSVTTGGIDNEMKMVELGVRLIGLTNVRTRIGDGEDLSIVDDIVPSLVSQEENSLLVAIPSADVIHDAVFAMDALSAPGPDGFSGRFFQRCWEIVGRDVILTVQDFFHSGVVAPGLNSNFIVLISKMRDSITIDQFRPIVLGNFLFKVSSKILADRLAQIAARIVSLQQFGFIRDRHVEDCIALASDCVNVLHKKCYGGNVAIKIDIRKAFDTLDWKFLFRMVTKKIRNFLWTGSCEETKLVRVAWNRCCRPYAFGGLGLKELALTNYVELIKDGIWLIGENSQRDFWRVNWLGIPILDLLGIPDFLATHLQAKVSDFIRDGRWILDDCFRARFPDLCFRIGRIVISPVIHYLVWPHARERSVSCKAAYARMFHDIPQAMSVSFSYHIRVLWRAVIHAVVWSVWYSRNQWIFEGNSFDFKAALSLVWHSVYDANCLVIGCMRNCADDLLILHRLGLSGRPGKAPIIRSVVWSPPAPRWIKVNTDGAALGSPGVGDYGGVFRTCRSFVKACFVVPLGQVFAFEAELLAASLAINYAWNLGWSRIWLESDSSYVVQLLSIRSDQVTWSVRQAWQRCIHQISHMEFQVSHIFREGNQVADALSKHTLGLSFDSWWSSTPSLCSSLVGNDCMGRESFRFS